ncbi:MAG: hypothetical protein JO331_04590 [Verrucomicrobia bacterium]|nr:hypothetical protein [Verrucomicrobiota bacterium]
MRSIAQRWLALAIASIGLYLALPNCGLAQTITLGTLKGTYVGAFSGQFSDPVSGNLITFTAAETKFCSERPCF